MAQGTEQPEQKSSWQGRLASALLLLLGAANALFGVLSLATDLVRLEPGTAVTLLTLGLATAALGVLVWRGSREAVTVALVVFGLLLVAQVANVATSESDARAAAPRLVVLAVLVAALALARFLPPTSGRR